MQKLGILLLIVVATTAIAEELISVEQKEQLVHFIYPPEDNKAYYYAVWSASKNSCQKINLTSKKLVFNRVAEDKSIFYRVPKKGGYLCLRRSESKLGGRWANYRVIPGEHYLIVGDDESRGAVEDQAETGIPDESEGYVLSCHSKVESELKTCGIFDSPLSEGASKEVK